MDISKAKPLMLEVPRPVEESETFEIRFETFENVVGELLHCICKHKFKIKSFSLFVFLNNV